MNEPTPQRPDDHYILRTVGDRTIRLRKRTHRQRVRLLESAHAFAKERLAHNLGLIGVANEELFGRLETFDAEHRSRFAPDVIAYLMAGPGQIEAMEMALSDEDDPAGTLEYVFEQGAVLECLADIWPIVVEYADEKKAGGANEADAEAKPQSTVITPEDHPELATWEAVTTPTVPTVPTIPAAAGGDETNPPTPATPGNG